MKQLINLTKMSISKAVTSRQEIFTIWGEIFTDLIHCIFHNTMSLSIFWSLFPYLFLSLFYILYGIHQTINTRKEYKTIVYFNCVLLDKSFIAKDIYKYSRSLSILHRKQNSVSIDNRYKDYTDLAIRNFIKGLFSTPTKYNLTNDFKNYSEIVDFIKDYKRDARVSRHSLYKLKVRRIIIKHVPRTKETERFVEYIKTRYKNFDDNAFFGHNKCIYLNSDKIIKYTLKRFCTDAFICLTPSLIILIIISYYDFNESSNLNSIIFQDKNDYELVDNNLNEISYNKHDTNNRSYVDNLTSSSYENSDSRTVIKICSSIALTMLLIMFIYAVFPPDGIEILQGKLGDGPYSPDTLRNTEDILAEIARRKSI